MVEQFILTVDGVPYSIEIKGNHITVNGYPLTLELDEEMIRIEGSEHEVELFGSQAIVDGIAYGFEVEWPADDSDSPPTRGAASVVAADEGSLNAIMPGKIISISVQEGEQVQKGQVLAILEAMKMENELSAPRDGIVKCILVAPGATVELGQPLIEIE